MIDLIKQWKDEGRNEGLEKGIEKGERQKAIETAQNLIKMELTDEQISQATGLSIEDVQKLRQSTKQAPKLQKQTANSTKTSTY